MIIKSYEITKIQKEVFNCFLIYGENIGLKKDAVKYLIKSNKDNKYKKLEYDEEEILNDPNNFYNLIFSGSLFDDNKIIIINKTTDKLLNLVEDILQKEIKDILFFFKADLLEKKSKIRSYFEKNKKLACIPCYQDTNYNLTKIINNEIRKEKIKLSAESINLLAERANGDRNNLQIEIDKLKSFALKNKSITYEQLKELTNMTSKFDNNYIVNICLNGDKKKLNKTIGENSFSLEDIYILLKTFSKKVHRLLQIKILNREEKNIEQIFYQITPPIFWKEKDDVKKQILLWNEKKLNLIINKINQIELNCKKNHEISAHILLDFLCNVCDEVNSYS